MPPARRLAALGCLLLGLGACSSGSSAKPIPSTPPATSSSATSSAPSATPDPVATTLAGMDRRAQVAQLFLAGVRLEDLSAGDELVADGVGGIFMAGRSAAAATDLAATVDDWQSAAPGPGLWVAVDQEGGSVQSLRGPGFEMLPSALDQGALPPDQLAGLADRLGASLDDAGVNLDLAPVVDVVPAGTESANPPIGAFDRQYGSTAAAVEAAAGTIVDGLAAHGVTATLKHFPGLGRVQGNTDTSAVVVDDTTTADDEQVAAFGDLARSPAAPFVMASSATYTLLDPTTPAAFSSAVLTGLLRERLGFDGVVVSDDVGAARAVEGLPPGERAVRFLGAGGTMVLTVDATIVPEMIDAVLARAAADPTFAAQVDAAVRTALEAKQRAGLLPT
jgi:beta-glucosidase-like glycosyl hydrolase